MNTYIKQAALALLISMLAYAHGTYAMQNGLVGALNKYATALGDLTTVLSGKPGAAELAKHPESFVEELQKIIQEKAVPLGGASRLLEDAAKKLPLLKDNFPILKKLSDEDEKSKLQIKVVEHFVGKDFLRKYHIKYADAIKIWQVLKEAREGKTNKDVESRLLTSEDSPILINRYYTNYEKKEKSSIAPEVDEFIRNRITSFGGLQSKYSDLTAILKKYPTHLTDDQKFQEGLKIIDTHKNNDTPIIAAKAIYEKNKIMGFSPSVLESLSQEFDNKFGESLGLGLLLKLVKHIEDAKSNPKDKSKCGAIVDQAITKNYERFSTFKQHLDAFLSQELAPIGWLGKKYTITYKELQAFCDTKEVPKEEPTGEKPTGEELK